MYYVYNFSNRRTEQFIQILVNKERLDWPKWVQTPRRTSHSGRWTRSLSCSWWRKDAGSTACSFVISSAVRWRTKRGFPRHLKVTLLPSGMSLSFISIFASARTSADALMLSTNSWTSTFEAYVAGTAPAKQIKHQNKTMFFLQLWLRFFFVNLTTTNSYEGQHLKSWEISTSNMY